MTSLKFTCITCQVAFNEFEWQKEHFTCDWHRYNCKRKSVDLPPVSVEEFSQRLLAKQEKIAEENDTSKFQCKPCGKLFAKKNSFENHRQSKKHLQREKLFLSIRDDPVSVKITPTNEKEEETEEIEEIDSDEWEDEAIAPNDCLFCLHHSANIEKNIKHMTNIHSFFVPDLEYCIDLNGLMTYLGEKVGSGHQCLWCNQKSRNFNSSSAVQRHMVDKGHCAIKHEGDSLLEYESFYDYSSSYPDADSANPDDEPSLPEQLTIDNGFELVLPSGGTVGHRSLLRYYKQRLNPNRSLVLKTGSSMSMKEKLICHYKALGWNGATTADVKKKARDIQFLRRLDSKHYMRLGVKANKFQPHLRPQVVF